MIQLSKILMLCVLTTVLMAGCRVLDGGVNFDDVSLSELEAIRDSFYLLELVPVEGDASQLTFVTCHLDKNNLADSSTSGCVSAFVDSKGRPVTIPKDLLDKTIASHQNHKDAQKNKGIFFWNRNKGEFTESIGEQSLQSNVNEDDNELGKQLAHNLTLVSSVGTVQGGVALAGVIGGVVIAAKGIAVVGAAAGTLMIGVTTVAIGSGSILYFVNSNHSDFLGMYREKVKDSMSKTGENLADSATKIVHDSALGVAQAMVDANEKSEGEQAELSMVLWGSASRSLARNFEKIIDDESSIVHSVNARIPDMLPLLAGVLEGSSLVEKGTISHHCLPRHKTSRRDASACISLKENWHTGGMLRYVKPTLDK